MFTCYKCGFEYTGDIEKTHCPICATNITIPKYALGLFLSLVSFIIFTLLSVFFEVLGIFSAISIICAIVFLPLAISEAIGRANEFKDGFRTPDSPYEVIFDNLRIPDFQTYDYVGGEDYDDGVKKILLEPYKDGLNYYHKNLHETQKINYNDILGLELYNQEKYEASPLKALFSSLLFGSFGGVGAGMLGYLWGGIKIENKPILKITYNDKDVKRNLYLSSNKTLLKSLISNIKNKANQNDD